MWPLKLRTTLPDSARALAIPFKRLGAGYSDRRFDHGSYEPSDLEALNSWDPKGGPVTQPPSQGPEIAFKSI